jgi:hypothetical protein
MTKDNGCRLFLFDFFSSFDLTIFPNKGWLQPLIPATGKQLNHDLVFRDKSTWLSVFFFFLSFAIFSAYYDLTICFPTKDDLLETGDWQMT